MVRLEAHMLLTEKKPWYVVRNNNALKKCFNPESDEIINKNAFVELNVDEYNEMKTFLTKYHSLSDNDFNIETDKKEDK